MACWTPKVVHLSRTARNACQAVPFWQRGHGTPFHVLLSDDDERHKCHVPVRYIVEQHALPQRRSRNRSLGNLAGEGSTARAASIPVPGPASDYDLKITGWSCKIRLECMPREGHRASAPPLDSQTPRCPSPWSDLGGREINARKIVNKLY
eukprot:323651-Chlamydomonas_euryale.AAC.2